MGIKLCLNLFQLNNGTSLFDSLLQVLSLVLRQTFLNGSGSTINEILSFLQAKTASFLNSLYNLQLSCTDFLQNNVERRLLFSCLSSTTCSRTSSNSSLTSFTVRFTNSSAIALISAILFKILIVFNVNVFYLLRSPIASSRPWILPPAFRAEITFLAGDCSRATTSAISSFLLFRAASSSSLSAPTKILSSA